MRKLFIKISSILLMSVLVLTACGSKDKKGDEKTSTSSTASTEKNDKKVGIVVSAAGQNDSGYNKAICKRLEEMSKKDGFHLQIVEPTNGVPNAIETLASDGYGLIFSMEYDFDALINGTGGSDPLAAQYPDTNFVVFNDNPNLDESGNVIHKNVYSVLFNVNQPSYLAGYLYTLMNENQDKLFGDEYKLEGLDNSRAAGFIGGTNSNGIKVDSYAFIQGINDVAKDLNVKYDYYAKYDAGFTDPTLGSSTAGTYFDNGANIVFADAGTVGDGVTSKAKEVGRLSIQVDADLDAQQPGYVITSILKLTDVPGESITDAYLGGTIKDLDNLQTFGIDTGATEITDLSEISKNIKDKDTWEEIKGKVEEKRQDIISGKLKVIDAQAGEELNKDDYKFVNIK